MLCSPLDTDGASLFVNVRFQSTRIGTIMRTCPIDNPQFPFLFSLHGHTLKNPFNLWICLLVIYKYVVPYYGLYVKSQWQEGRYSQAPVPVSQSRIVSGICETAACR